MIDSAATWRAFCPSSTATGGVAPVQAVRDAQVQVVAAPFGKALRFEVRHGDVYSNYSDARALITGPAEMWEDEGNERWYRWRPMWPVGWVGSYPKWDEPGARSGAGSSLEWHHEPFGGGMESGSAPLYIGADDTTVWLHLVDQKTSEVRKILTLANLTRGRWYDLVFHVLWSPDPAKGLFEVWESGVKAWTLRDYNMYPNTRMYPQFGLYRNEHIGENDASGLPGYCFAGGFARGASFSEVMGVPSAKQPPPTAAELMAQRARLQQLVLQLDASAIAAQQESAAVQVEIAAINKKLDAGPW